MLSTTLTRCILGATLTTTVITTPTTASARTPALIAAQTTPMGPESAALQLTPPGDTYRKWSDERRKLRIQLGVSAGLAAAFFLGAVLAVTVNTCNPPPDVPDYSCGMPIGPIMAGGTLLTASAVSLIPTIVFGVRLGRHNRLRPQAQLQLAPGGLSLRF